jgi:hypothetical protein
MRKGEGGGWKGVKDGARRGGKSCIEVFIIYGQMKM